MLFTNENWIDSNKLSFDLKRNQRSVSRSLLLFEERGVLEIEKSENGYRLNPQNAELLSLIKALHNEHQLRPHKIYELIYSPLKKARNFANAFNLSLINKKKEDKDG